MDHALTRSAISARPAGASHETHRAPETSVGAPDWHAGAGRFAPLWRHAVWAVAVFALLTLWVDIRVDVQQLRGDLDRSGRARREAQVQNDRLRLELDVRRRALALEAMAGTMGIADGAEIVEVAVPARGPSGRGPDEPQAGAPHAAGEGG